MTNNSQKANDVRSTLAGPHVCSRVGSAVSSMLKNALLETCKHRGGSLNQDEILQVIDLVVESQEVFSVFQNAYSGCVGISQAGRFLDVDQRTIFRFVTGALCRDTIPGVFAKQMSTAGNSWQRAFISGFSDFLSGELNPTLCADLYKAYQKLSISSDEQLTPLTILNAPGVASVMGGALHRLRSAGEANKDIFSDMENQINQALSRALKLNGPSPLKINDRLASSFLDAISKPSPSNPFRSLVLKAAK